MNKFGRQKSKKRQNKRRLEDAKNLPAGTHKQGFEQLLDDAIFGVTRKKNKLG